MKLRSKESFALIGSLGAVMLIGILVLSVDGDRSKNRSEQVASPALSEGAPKVENRPCLVAEVTDHGFSESGNWYEISGQVTNQCDQKARFVTADILVFQNSRIIESRPVIVGEVYANGSNQFSTMISKDIIKEGVSFRIELDN